MVQFNVRRNLPADFIGQAQALGYMDIQIPLKPKADITNLARRSATTDNPLELHTFLAMI